MSFDSPMFISVFFPVVLAVLFLAKSARCRKLLLLAFSLIFCAFGSLIGVSVMLAAAGVNYLLARLDERYRRSSVFVFLAVIADLSLLFLFKYLTFFLGGRSPLPNETLELLAPVGVSFFTFKCISYVVDVHRGAAACGSLPDFLLYVSFFPQAAAGPISRFDGFVSGLCETRPDMEALFSGFCRFVIGLAKKVIISGALGKAANAVFAAGTASLGAFSAWLGAISYTLQIYYDFSGYTDMAVGIGLMLGVSTPENFMRPYAACSITDFWRRWHISLSFWFRDYLYIPLGGSRRGRLRAGINKLIVFALCGLWHGAEWTFVVWGLWHGMFAFLETVGILPKSCDGLKLPARAAMHIYTLLAVCLGFVFFRASSLSQAFLIFRAMLGFGGHGAEAAVFLHSLLTPFSASAIVISVLFCLPLRLPERFSPDTGLGLALRATGCTLLFALCLVFMAGSGFVPFIYSQF